MIQRQGNTKKEKMGYFNKMRHFNSTSNFYFVFFCLVCLLTIIIRTIIIIIIIIIAMLVCLWRPFFLFLYFFSNIKKKFTIAFFFLKFSFLLITKIIYFLFSKILN